MRTLIFVFALNSHLQSFLNSSNGFFWTLSADTEFPREDRYRIKTDQLFLENVAGQRKAWNKWPSKGVVGDTKDMLATSLQKNISSYISFSKKPKSRGIFLVFLGYSTLRAEIFTIINYCGIYFCDWGMTKKMYFAELVFAISMSYGKKSGIYFCDANALTKFL